MKYQKLKKEAFHSMCRQCINEQYGLQLKTRDCYYLPYQKLCSCCGNIKNIVADISRHSRWRLFFARQKETVNHSNLLYHRRNTVCLTSASVNTKRCRPDETKDC